MKKFCIIVSALIMLFAAGCSKQAQQEPEVSAPEETKRILVSCIGDSITYGAGVSLEKEKYPYMLQKELGKDYEVLNHGISARTMLKDGRDSENSTVTFSYWDTQAFKKANECEPDMLKSSFCI